MTASATADLQIASVRRQFLAGVIDVVSLLGSIGLLAGSGAWAYHQFIQGDSGSGDGITCADGSCGRRGMSKTQTVILAGATQTAGVLMRNTRGPGARIMHIRRVEVRTGGPVSARTALVASGAGTAWGWLIGRAFGPLQRRTEERVRTQFAAAQAEIEELRREYPDDLQTLNRELMGVFKRHNVSPFPSCLPSVARTVVSVYLPKLLSPRNQGIPERLAGIVTVVER